MTIVEQDVTCPKCGGKMWDNRATLHRGRPWPDNLHPRDMRRTTISAGDADGVAELRPARAAA